MSDTNTMTAEAPSAASDNTTAPAAPAPLSTASSPWELKAAGLGANADLHVQVSDPQIDGQTKRVTFLAPEDLSEDGTTTVRLPFRVEEECVTTDGTKKAPGLVVRPFPRTLAAAPDAEAKDKERAAKDLRSVALDLVGVGLLKRGSDPTIGDIYRAISKLEGRQADCKFSVTKGAKRDENGEFKTFQNYRFAVPGAANGEAKPVSNGGSADY